MLPHALALPIPPKPPGRPTYIYSPPLLVDAMMNVTLEGADMYLRVDSSRVTRYLVHDEPMPAVTLIVYGPTYALTLLFPTDDLQDLSLANVNTWISLFHGPLRSQCKASEDQFDTLMDVALTYRAFATHHDQLTPQDFVDFTDRLIRAAMELHPLESADDELQELVGWLHVNMPEDIYDCPELRADYANEAQQVHGSPIAPFTIPNAVMRTLHRLSIDRARRNSAGDDTPTAAGEPAGENDDRARASPGGSLATTAATVGPAVLNGATGAPGAPHTMGPPHASPLGDTAGPRGRAPYKDARVRSAHGGRATAQDRSAPARAPRSPLGTNTASSSPATPPPATPDDSVSDCDSDNDSVPSLETVTESEDPEGEFSSDENDSDFD